MGGPGAKNVKVAFHFNTKAVVTKSASLQYLVPLMYSSHSIYCCVAKSKQFIHADVSLSKISVAIINKD